MNYTQYLGALLLLLSVNLFGQNDSLWQQGNDFYISQEYESALNTWERIIEKGYESSDLYFNIGNAYYKMRNIPLAILNYERANLLNPNDDDILFNLELARTQTIDKIEVLPSVVLKNWYHRFISSVSSDGWAYISVISFVIFLILVLIYLFSKAISYKKTGFILAVFMLLVSFGSFIFALNSRSVIINNNEAVITEPTVVVRGEPNESGTELFVLHEGTKVLITDKVGGHVEIRLTDGNNGWIPETDLTKVRTK